MPSGITFEEIECKTIINRVQAPGMGFSYTINPYRGCQHACIYCFARARTSTWATTPAGTSSRASSSR